MSVAQTRLMGSDEHCPDEEDDDEDDEKGNNRDPPPPRVETECLTDAAPVSRKGVAADQYAVLAHQYRTQFFPRILR